LAQLKVLRSGFVQQQVEGPIYPVGVGSDPALDLEFNQESCVIPLYDCSNFHLVAEVSACTFFHLVYGRDGFLSTFRGERSPYKDMDDINKKIIEIITDLGPLTRKAVHQRLDGCGMKLNIRNVQRRLTALVKEGELVPMPGGRYELASRYKEWEDTKFKERRIHTKELKRLIIRPWLEQLPVVSLDEMCGWNIESYARWSGLEVEKHVLFNDFMRHCSTFRPNPYNRLTNFKTLWAKCWRKRKELMRDLTEWVKEAFDNFATVRYLPVVVIGQGLRAAHAREHPRERAEKHPLLASEELKPILDYVKTVEYRIADLPVLELRKEDYPEKDQLVRQRINHLRTEIAKGRFSKDFDDLSRMLRDLEGLKDDMEKVLNKYLVLVVFKGQCEYLR